MRRRICMLMLLILSSFTLTGCIKERVEAPSKPSISIPSIPEGGETTPGTDSTQSPDANPTESTEENENPLENEFSVKLIYNGKPFKPAEGEELKAIWTSNEGQTKIANIDENGVAKTKGLDGDFFVHLNKAPDGYTYNPNNIENFVTNDFRDLEIKLYRISRPRRGSGQKLENPFEMSNTGYYNATIERDKKVFFQFSPDKPGTYYFESLVDCYNDSINPIADIYRGTFAFMPPKPFKSVDTGGFSFNGGYSKNFRFGFEVKPDEIGNVYAFAIGASTKNNIYPCKVDFLILHSDEYEIRDPNAGTLKIANEAEKAKIKENNSRKILYNSDFGTNSYYVTGETNGTGILDGSYYRYNEAKGIYYLINPETGEDLAPVVCFIDSPCPYYPKEQQGSLTGIQSAGNSALTVRNKNGERLDYTYFIETQYKNVADNKGMTYVTKELKEFLQMFSNSQQLFMDGMGWCERFKVYSTGDDQWLFACGFYYDGELPFNI